LAKKATLRLSGAQNGYVDPSVPARKRARTWSSSWIQRPCRPAPSLPTKTTRRPSGEIAEFPAPATIEAPEADEIVNLRSLGRAAGAKARNASRSRR